MDVDKMGMNQEKVFQKAMRMWTYMKKHDHVHIMSQ